jgi:hypothetical protein
VGRLSDDLGTFALSQKTRDGYAQGELPSRDEAGIGFIALGTIIASS